MKLLKKLFGLLKNVKVFHFAKISSAYIIQLSNLICVFFLSAGEYGELSLIIAAAQFIFIMSAGISNGALINIGTRRFIETGKYFDVVVYRYSFVILMLLLLGFSFFMMEAKISNWLSIGSISLFVPMLAISYVMYELASQLLYPSKYFKKQAYIELFLACTFIVSVLLVVRSIENFIYAYFFVSIIGAITIVVVYVKNGMYTRFHFKGELCKEVYIFSSWQVVGVLSIFFLNSGYSYLLVYYDFSKPDIGVLNFSLKLFLGMSGVFSLALILMPRLVHASGEKSLIKNINYNFTLIVLALGGVYLLAALIIYQIISYMERSEYLLSVEYMVYLMPAFLCMAYSNLLNTFFANTHLFRVAQIVIVLQAVVFILSAYFLLDSLGALGLVVSYSISYFIAAMCSYVLFSVNRNSLVGDHS